MYEMPNQYVQVKVVSIQHVHHVQKITPTTNFKTGQTSINACKPVPKKNCEPGYEVINGGIKKKKECTKCKTKHIHSVAMMVKCKQCPSDTPTTNFRNDFIKQHNICTKNKM